jgi:hypothetical protein
MKHITIAAVLLLGSATGIGSLWAADAPPAPKPATPAKATPKAEASFDLVCSMIGFAGNDIMRPTKFERRYSVDFKQMKRCDRYQGQCGTVDPFTVQGGLAVLGDAPDSRGPDFFQSDYNLTSNVLMETLASRGKIMSQTAGLCKRRALTPLDYNPPAEDDDQHGATSSDGEHAG